MDITLLYDLPFYVRSSTGYLFFGEFTVTFQTHFDIWGAIERALLFQIQSSLVIDVEMGSIAIKVMTLFDRNDANIPLTHSYM